jgi:hypothetical protein
MSLNDHCAYKKRSVPGNEGIKSSKEVTLALELINHTKDKNTKINRHPLHTTSHQHRLHKTQPQPGIPGHWVNDALKAPERELHFHLVPQGPLDDV